MLEWEKANKLRNYFSHDLKTYKRPFFFIKALESAAPATFAKTYIYE